MANEVIEVLGAGIVAGLAGELARRAVLGRRFERKLAAVQLNQPVRVIGSDHELSNALEQALDHRRMSIKSKALSALGRYAVESRTPDRHQASVAE